PAYPRDRQQPVDRVSIEDRLGDRSGGVGDQGALQFQRHRAVDRAGEACEGALLRLEAADAHFVTGAEEDPPVPAILLPFEQVDREEVADQRTVEVRCTLIRGRLIERTLAADPVQARRSALPISAEAQPLGAGLLAGGEVDEAPFALLAG